MKIEFFPLFHSFLAQTHSIPLRGSGTGAHGYLAVGSFGSRGGRWHRDKDTLQHRDTWCNFYKHAVISRGSGFELRFSIYPSSSCSATHGFHSLITPQRTKHVLQLPAFYLDTTTRTMADLVCHHHCAPRFCSLILCLLPHRINLLPRAAFALSCPPLLCQLIGLHGTTCPSGNWASMAIHETTNEILDGAQLIFCKYHSDHFVEFSESFSCNQTERRCEKVQSLIVLAATGSYWLCPYPVP